VRKLRIAVLLVLFCTTPTFGQMQPKPDKHADLADRKMCYEQAQKYVADSNAKVIQDKLAPWRDYHWTFEAAHYDVKTQTCYVQYERHPQTFPPESTAYVVVDEIRVDDAFEGKEIAAFVGGYSMDKQSGKTANSPLTFCQVNGEKCNERAVFNGLLWKLIPAFRPVMAVDVK
jgi:hypothetical protein